MKKLHMILILALWMVAGSCSTYYVSNQQVMEVQQGMSQKNVEKILGKPDYRRFDGDMEEWEFHRVSSVLYATSMRIIVFFADGRVVSMDTFNGDVRPHPAPPVIMPAPVVVNTNPGYPPKHEGEPHRRPRAMSPAEFNRFFRDFKNEPFESGRTKMLDEVVLPSGFTCVQGRKLVELYTFDTEKKNMIKKLYPKIDDQKNFSVLTDIFTFEMDKREMREFAESYDSRRN